VFKQIFGDIQMKIKRYEHMYYVDV